MNDGGTELAASLMTCMSWLVILLHIAMGVVGLVRLKATPAGFLIGGGLMMFGITSMIRMVVRTVLLSPEALAESVDPMQIFGIFRIASSCSGIFFVIIVTVGFALLPSSLAKLAKLGATNAPAPAQPSVD